MAGWFAGKVKAKNWFSHHKTGSHTSTEDTRGVRNIEENGTDGTATGKKIIMQAEKAFPPGNVFVAYEFIATQNP